MNEYIESVIKTVERRDSAKPEYIQSVKEVFHSLEKVIEQHPPDSPHSALHTA